MKPVGTVVSNQALGATLSAIREEGPDGFYRGPVPPGSRNIRARKTARSRWRNWLPAPQRNRAAATPSAARPPISRTNNLGSGAFAESLLSQLVDAQGAVMPAENLTASVASATKATLDKFDIASCRAISARPGSRPAMRADNRWRARRPTAAGVGGGLLQELEEVAVAVARVAGVDDRAGGHLQGGEQGVVPCRT